LRSPTTIRWIRSLGIALVSAVAIAAPPAKLLPVDEAASDPSFVAFRMELKKAIENHDAAFLRAGISQDIELGGDKQGPQEFEQEWQPDDPDSELWGTLQDVLALGGAFTAGGRQFCAPYVYSKWPEGVDRSANLAVIGKGVKLHTSCAENTPMVASLEYDLVSWNNSTHETVTKGGKEWAQVKTADGKTGCVLDDYVRSPLDYRACFEKIQGQWKLTVLAEGE
jgi:hypothetical protein